MNVEIEFQTELDRRIAVMLRQRCKSCGYDEGHAPKCFSPSKARTQKQPAKALVVEAWLDDEEARMF